MRIALALSWMLVAVAQAQPDANQILRKVWDRYAAAKSLEITGTIRITTRRQGDGEITREKTVATHASFTQPDKYVIEVDGEATPVSSEAAAREKILDPFRYSELITAKVLREEAIGTRSCYVIEVHAPWTSDGGDLEWVDQERLVVLRQENTLIAGGLVETTRVDYVVRIDVGLPESGTRIESFPK